MNSRIFLLASEFIGAVIETINMRVNFNTIYIHRAYTNLAGIMDPEKEVGTDALSAKDKEDEYELESENTSSIQIIAKRKKF